MSSRAVRKLQREEDERKQLAKLQENGNDNENIEDDEAETPPLAPLKPNAFNMLNAVDVNQGDAVDEDDAGDDAGDNSGDNTDAGTRIQAPSKTKKKKKGKKKKKPQVPGQDRSTPSGKPQGGDQNTDLDEIDVALMSIKDTASSSKDAEDDKQRPSEDLKRLYQLLATDAKYLNALNEMKRLFGNVVLEGEDAEGPGPAQGRRRERGRRQLDLGAALAARNSPVSRGQGLVGLALRRNVFMVGKESWPKATSGGLGMEVVEKAWDLTVEYRYVHSSVYQDVQKQFHTCVESMDPQRMVDLLHYNPYHISTLLVVSEIAEQQGDHSLAGELLERALFSFGRSVHSTFHNAMAEGKARLDFRRPENREFWLVAWRYIKNLGQRGTWRTAYEWAKLLLSFDPEEDPYGIHLILDQLAVRSAQFENIVDLTQSLQSVFSSLKRAPNLEISLALAQHKLKQAGLCRNTLKTAVSKYPWVFVRLFQELNIGHIPKSIWGTQPETPRDKLETEAYVTRGKDLWNTPEAISLLVEVVESAGDVERHLLGRHIGHNFISESEARHILLSEIPSLIALLPREYTTAPSSAYDVLPPEDSMPSYAINGLPDEEDDTDGLRNWTNEPAGSAGNQETDEVQELHGLQNFFTRLIPWLRRPAGTPGNVDEQEEDEMGILAERSGVPAEVIESRTRRMLELQNRFLEHELENGENDTSNETRAREEALVDAMFNSQGPIETLMNLDNDQLDAVLNETPVSDSQVPEQPAGNSSSLLDELPEPYDDQRNQRWLAGQGMLRLKDFIAEHGTDEHVFLGLNKGIDFRPVTDYAYRVTLLEKRATRNFILDYVLQQGTSSEVKELIVRVLDGVDKCGGWKNWHESFKR